jgi:hypothetical protein
MENSETESYLVEDPLSVFRRVPRLKGLILKPPMSLRGLDDDPLASQALGLFGREPENLRRVFAR